MSSDSSPSQPSEEPLDRVEELVAACLDVPDDEREAALARVCKEHPALADDIRGRLRALSETLANLTGAAPLPERLGEFRILRRLGDGGMGVVYEAEQESLGRRVAIKVVRPELMFFERARERFRREVEAVAQLKDPGIVPVYSVGEEDGVPFFAMELVDGCTLGELIDRVRGTAPERLSERDLVQAITGGRGLGSTAELPTNWRRGWVFACIDLARQVALVLAHAHEHGIVHRDVKPSNIVLGPDLRPRLLDFGLAADAARSGLTQSGAMLGTLHYMAPEQVHGSDTVDARADVYSLGATLYHLLALQTPFHGETAVDLQSEILAGATASLRGRNRAVPVDVETVVRTAMERDPGRRYASALAFAQDLDNLLSSRSIVARPPGQFLRLRRWARRRPAVATGVVAGFLLFFAVPTAFLVRELAHSSRLQTALDEKGEALDEERVARQQGERALEFLTGLFRAADPTSSPDLDVSARLLLDRAADRILGELDDDPKLKARLLWNLGDVYRNADRPRAALPLLEAALPLARAAWGGESEDVAAILDSLASALWRLGDNERAEALFRDALAINLEIRGDQPLVVAGSVNNLALVLLARGQKVEAESLLQRALALYQDAGAEGEESRVSVAINFAEFLLGEKRPEDAREIAAEAVDVLRRLHPDPHPLVVVALNTYGRALRALRDFDGAEKAYREAIEQQKVVGTEDDATLPSLQFNLYKLKAAAGRLDAEGAELLKEAVAGIERALGPDAPLTKMFRQELERYRK